MKRRKCPNLPQEIREKKENEMEKKKRKEG
jgi:hypothetical protein